MTKGNNQQRERIEAAIAALEVLEDDMRPGMGRHTIEVWASLVSAARMLLDDLMRDDAG